MVQLKPIALALAGAGLGLSALIAVGGLVERNDEVFLDPVLSGNGAFCLSPPRNGQGLLQYYQKVAAAQTAAGGSSGVSPGSPAKTEVRPFSTETQGGGDTAYHKADPPLWDNLGALSMPITTRNPQAQRYFDQGLRLAFAFNHAEARRAFRKAQQLDPDCAMCYWGEALVLGPNINAPMQASALAPALAALHQAKAAGASTREQALITALNKRYSNDPKAERPALDAAYAEAMGEVAARYPKDHNIQVLYAESLMDLSPWDYWQVGGSQPKGKTAEILATLERVLAENPDHTGAIHYYIHLVEASDRPERAEPYAERLGATMPGAGHVVHMPFHIYFRIGRYRDAIAANRAAVEADRAYIAEVKPEGIYPQAYYPHNIHSLMVSAQMAGDGKTAVQAAEDLSRVVTAEAGRAIPWVQEIIVAPYFAHAQFSAPETVLALPDPGSELPYVKAMWHYARGVANAAKGNVEAAEREAEAIARLGKQGNFAGLVDGGVPAPEVLALARHIVLGRIAQARGDLGAAQAQFEQAVAIQDELAYMEPPHWYYPVRQSLGAVMALRGDLKGAEEVFRMSLMRAPHNGWAIYGLKEVYERMNRSQAVAELEKRLDQTWAGDRQTLDLRRL
jgi:tetratricopeptide (TPR) repeat protein